MMPTIVSKSLAQLNYLYPVIFLVEILLGSAEASA